MDNLESLVYNFLLTKYDQPVMPSEKDEASDTAINVADAHANDADANVTEEFLGKFPDANRAAMQYLVAQHHRAMADYHGPKFPDAPLPEAVKRTLDTIAVDLCQ